MKHTTFRMNNKELLKFGNKIFQKLNIHYEIENSRVIFNNISLDERLQIQSHELEILANHNHPIMKRKSPISLSGLLDEVCH